MQSLWNAHISTPVLATPNSIPPLTLNSVVSDGFILQYRFNKTVQPIRCWSRSLTVVEYKYGTAQREFLAIVWVVLLECQYLKKTKFSLRTDRDPLKRIQIVKDCTGRQARWRRGLRDFKFDVVDCVEIVHQGACALSRLQTTTGDCTILANDLPIFAVDVRESEKDIHFTDKNCKEVLPLKAEAPLAGNTPLCEDDTILKQANDCFSEMAATQVGHRLSKFSVHKKGPLMRNYFVEKERQIFVLPSLQTVLSISFITLQLNVFSTFPRTYQDSQ